MSNRQATILEVNGKRYDAKTGALLGVAENASSKSIPAKPAKQSQPSQANLKPAAKKTMDIMPRTHGHTATAHKPERAVTLMRSGVKKPTTPTRLKAVTATDILAKKPNLPVHKKASIQAVDPHKVARAQVVPKSGLVKKFATDITPQRPRSAFIAPTPATAVKPTAQPVQTAKPHNTKHSMDVFQRALAKADAHLEQPFDPKKRDKALKKAERAARRHQHQKVNRHWSLRIAAIISIVLVTVLVVGVTLYQHRVELALKFASSKAGFTAIVPDYAPPGFHYKTTTYDTSKVAVTYSDPDAMSSYTLTEQKTTWNDQALISNFIEKSNSTYQTIKSSGRTFYIYGNNRVSWIYQGVWYQIDPDGSLSTTDVINIANSF